MKVNPETRGGRFALSLAGLLLRCLLLTLGATWRWRVVAGSETLAQVLEAKKPVVLSFWHNRAFMSAHFLVRRLLRRGLPIALLASQSRDGELATRVAEGLGISTIRGSASRGGRQAMWSIYRAIRKKGASPILIPDGPRGPLYHFKPGVLSLAQLSATPILPLGFAASRYWQIRSWDRLIVPKPFSTVTLVIGEIQQIDKELSEDAFEAERQRQQQLLDDVTQQAEKALSR